MYKNLTCKDLVDAVCGNEGDLDAYLEVTSEGELKVAIEALVEANRAPLKTTLDRDEIAVMAFHRIPDSEFRTRESAKRAVDRCYDIADNMLKHSKEGRL